MARKMWDGQPGKIVYRAVIVRTYSRDDTPISPEWIYAGGIETEDGKRVFISHYGPYSTVGTAKAQVTLAKKKALRSAAYRSGQLSFDGWVEQSTIEWQQAPD